jgi:hypothetical protein
MAEADGVARGAGAVRGGAAPLTVEQGFPALAEQHAALREHVRHEAPPNLRSKGGSGSGSDEQPGLGDVLEPDGGATVAAFELPQGSATFQNTALPLAYKAASDHLLCSVAFGLGTLLTALNRWAVHSGCVVDGAIFERLLYQHLHLKSVVTRVVSAAGGFIAEFLPDARDVEGALSALTATLVGELIASFYAVMKCRGFLYAVELDSETPVERAPGSFAAGRTQAMPAVFLGSSLQHALTAVVGVAAAVAERTESWTCVEMRERDAAVSAMWAKWRDACQISAEFPRMKHVREVADHQLEASRTGKASRPLSAAASNLHICLELYHSGYVSARLLEMMALHIPFDSLNTNAHGILRLVLGPAVLQLTRPLPVSFMNGHSVQLPSGGPRVITTHGLDFLAPAAARRCDPRVGRFLALALSCGAEQDSALLTGAVVVPCAPLSLFQRVVSAAVAQWQHAVTGLHMWQDALAITLHGNAHVLLLPDDGPDGTALTVRVCVAVFDQGRYLKAMQAQQQQQEGSPRSVTDSGSGIDGIAYATEGDVEGLFAVLAEVIEEEARLFHCDLSAVAAADSVSRAASPASSGVLSDGERPAAALVQASCTVGGQPVLPWEQLAESAREMLAGMKRSVIEPAMNTLRKLSERAVTDTSLEPLIAILIS